MKYKNSVKVNEDTVSKKRNDKVLELYDYLDITGFDNYPKVVDVSENEIRSEYINDSKYHEVTKCLELIKTMAKLHSKTFYIKNISMSKYTDIYDKINGNIEFLRTYYNDIMDKIESEVYMSPSHYLFARNYSSILGSLKYCTTELKKWFNIVKNKDSQRVCIVHNNMSSDHFIKGDKNYFISWDKYLVDTPILDLYIFYKKEGFKLNFKVLFDEYKKIFNLLPEEEILFKILISIPPKMVFLDKESENIIYIKDSLNYVHHSYKVVS